MPGNDQTIDSHAPRKLAKRFRRIGVIVLGLGLLSAGMVYWIRTRGGGPTEDELLAGNARAESQQMGILYGKMGLLTQKLSDDLKQPGTQALIIAGVSVVIAAGCFYFARLEDDQNEVH